MLETEKLLLNISVLIIFKRGRDFIFSAQSTEYYKHESGRFNNYFKQRKAPGLDYI